MSNEKPNEKTEPVSVYAGNRAVIRAIAGAAATSPAVIVDRALDAYLSDHPELAAVARAALAVATGATTRAFIELAPEDDRGAAGLGTSR